MQSDLPFSWKLDAKIFKKSIFKTKKVHEHVDETLFKSLKHLKCLEKQEKQKDDKGEDADNHKRLKFKKDMGFVT